jgi:hypothetical protein
MYNRGNSVGTCAFSSPEAQRISSDFFFGHGMFSQSLKQEMLFSCGTFQTLSAKCIETLEKMEDEIGNFNIYNIYDTCGSDQRRRRLHEVKNKKQRLSLSKVREILSSKRVNISTEDSFKVSAGYGEALNDYECGAETAMDAWLAEPSVATALHVKQNTPGLVYVKTATDLRPLYSELINKYQMLIYSGDTDGCVPYVGTEYWTTSLNFSVTKPWHQWLAKPNYEHGEHKAGYAITYSAFQFITINGAGHMVPQFQPGFALAMFQKFLLNEVF